MTIHKYVFYLSLMFLALSTARASADAETHNFQIYSLKDMLGDCYKDRNGKRICSPYCVVKARLINLTHSSAPDVTVSLHFLNPLKTHNPDQPDAEDVFTFQFQHVKVGESEATTADIPNAVCRKLRPNRVEIACETNLRIGLCGFINVEIAANKKLSLTRQRISN